jgi:hypothetical protein
MPVKQTQLPLLAGKFSTQMGSLAQSAPRFPFFAAREGALLAFFPALGLVFFGLRVAPFFTFLTAPAAALLAAFFGVPLDFFFFFFKVLLLSSSHLPGKALLLALEFLGPFLLDAQGTYGFEDFINRW